MSRIIQAFVLLFFSSCSLAPVNEISLKLEDFSYREIYSGSSGNAKRSIANEEDCVDLVEKILKVDDPEYLVKVKEDPFTAAEAEAAVNNATEKYPINLSNSMRSFRDRFLGLLKNPQQREPITRSFEAALRMRSKLTKEAILKNDGKADYDLVIVGTGVHGVIALHEALARNPKLKILLVDEGDTAGATFRYGKEVFNINSSNRASAIGSRALPGEGNINELPGLPIQVSDLTSVKYPTANDLGTSIVAGLYAAIREHPNVDVLFGTRAQSLIERTGGMDADVNEALRLVSSVNEQQGMDIGAQKIILTTGLGTPKLPEKVAKAIIENPELSKFTEGKVPKVVNFEDLVRMLAMSNDPVSLIKDKKIAVVGKGDSANVLIEFLLGYAAREGYAGSSAQSGRAQKIFWIGQDKKTCADFISDIRSRYQGISTGFRSSSKDLEAIITPYASKLSNVKRTATGRVTSELEDNSIVEESDIVVLTTGFDQDLRSLFSKITNGESTNLKSDTDFFARDFETLEGVTSTSAKVTKIGRKFNAREIYVVGTAAGNLTVKEELVGVIQNFVSIFNNAPRVVSSVKKIMDGLSPRVGSYKASKIILENTADKGKKFVIRNIQGTRTMGAQTLPYLESVFKEALTFTAAKVNVPMEFRVVLSKDGNLEVHTDGAQDLTSFVHLLASTREFFSLSKEALKVLDGKELLFKADGFRPLGGYHVYDLASAKLTVTKITEKEKRLATPIENQMIQFRGVQVKIPERRLEVTKVSDITQLLSDRINKRSSRRFDSSEYADAKYNLEFLPVAGGQFEVSFQRVFDSQNFSTYKVYIREIGNSSEDNLIEVFEVEDFIRFIKNKNNEVVSVYNGFGEKVVVSKGQEFFDTNVRVVTSGNAKKTITLKEFNETYQIPDKDYFCLEEGRSRKPLCVARVKLKDGREAVSVKYSLDEGPFKIVELAAGEKNTVFGSVGRYFEYVDANGEIKRISLFND